MLGFSFDLPAVAFLVPFASPAIGVGRPGDDEDPVPLVAGTDLGRSKSRPLRIEPEGMKVCENSTECPQRRFASGVSQTPRAGFHVAVGRLGEKSGHILDHDQTGVQGGYRAGAVMPDAGAVAVAESGTLAGEGDVLAGEAHGEDIDGRHLGEVDGGDVAEVRDVGVVVGQDRRRAGVRVGDPGQRSADDGLDGGVEPGVAAAERADARRGGGHSGLLQAVVRVLARRTSAAAAWGVSWSRAAMSRTDWPSAARRAASATWSRQRWAASDNQRPSRRRAN
jgi:hypothetical protein